VLPSLSFQLWQNTFHLIRSLWSLAPSLSHTHTHTLELMKAHAETHMQCFYVVVYSCNVTWRGAKEPVEGPWPEACRHLSAALLKCLFITLFQLHLPLSSASHHANPNTPGLSRLIQSMISERGEAFPSFSSFSCLNSPTLYSLPVFQRITLWERTELTEKIEERKEREGWIEEKREEAVVYSMQHRLLNWFQRSSWTRGIRGTHCRLDVFAFVGCRKSDLYPCSQPTSHIPTITTTRNDGRYEGSPPKTGITVFQ